MIADAEDDDPEEKDDGHHDEGGKVLCAREVDFHREGDDEADDDAQTVKDCRIDEGGAVPSDRACAVAVGVGEPGDEDDDDADRPDEVGVEDGERIPASHSHHDGAFDDAHKEQDDGGEEEHLSLMNGIYDVLFRLGVKISACGGDLYSVA